MSGGDSATNAANRRATPVAPPFEATNGDATASVHLSDDDENGGAARPSVSQLK